MSGLRTWAILVALTILGGGAVYSGVEKSQHLGLGDGIWWAIETITTLGYGTTYPRTTGGRVITAIVLFVGIGFVAVLTAAIAQRFLAGQEAGRHDEIIERLDALQARLDDLERR
jgi:voltage-gated potassium channel